MSKRQKLAAFIPAGRWLLPPAYPLRSMKWGHWKVDFPL